MSVNFEVTPISFTFEDCLRCGKGIVLKNGDTFSMTVETPTKQTWRRAKVKYPCLNCGWICVTEQD